jgi:hypothetical protein
MKTRDTAPQFPARFWIIHDVTLCVVTPITDFDISLVINKSALMIGKVNVWNKEQHIKTVAIIISGKKVPK